MKHSIALTVFTLAITGIALPAFAQDRLSVGYFKEWPLPALYGKANATFDEANGAPVIWKSFKNSSDMTSALISGDINIALSLGVVPTILANSADKDIEIIDVAVDYAASEGCVAKTGLINTTDSAKPLEGAKVALPVGTIVHFQLLSQLTALGVNATTMEFKDLPPQRAAVSFEQGSADIACGWGAVYEKLKTLGTPIEFPANASNTRPYVFDAIVTTASYASQHSDTVALFLKTNSELNADYLKAPELMLPTIASESGMTQAAAKATLMAFRFPTLSERLSATWLGGGVKTNITDLATFFLEQSTFEQPPDNLDTLVTANYLLKAQDLQQAEQAAEATAPATQTTETPPE